MNAEIDIKDVILNTNRLILRPFKETDPNDFFAYAKVDGVGEMAGWKHHESVEESKNILHFFISEKKTFAIVYDDKVIGSIGIEKYDEKVYPQLKNLKGREIGYVLSKDYWGQGIMPEAVKEVIRYLFASLNLDVILCSHFLDNKQSEKVQLKCGFKHYAYNPNYKTQMDTIVESEMMILFKKDYLLIN